MINYSIKRVLTLSSLSILFLIIVACSSGESGNQEREQRNNDEEIQTEQEPLEISEDDPLPVVTMTMETGEEIVMELYPQIAPNTVNNFISLINEQFYDGLIFHRVIPGFMIQGGDPEGTGMGGPGYSIKGEFAANGFDNPINHTKGTLSMARSNDPDSAGSQFFIMVEDGPHLDGDYAAFGQVVEGLDAVEKIVQVERDEMDKPLEDQIIESVTVDLNGYDFTEPETK